MVGFIGTPEGRIADSFAPGETWRSRKRNKKAKLELSRRRSSPASFVAARTTASRVAQIAPASMPLLKRTARSKNPRLILIDPGKLGDSIYTNALSIGLQITQKMARERGFDVQSFHMNRENESDILNAIQAGDIVGFTGTSSGHKMAVDMAKQIRAKLGDEVLIIKGGIHESVAGVAEQAKADYPVDISFIGYAEDNLPEVLDLVKRASREGQDPLTVIRNLNAIPSIAFKGRNNLAQRAWGNAENIVLPDFVDAEVREPFTIFRNPQEGSLMYRLMTMRGCPDTCTFCAIQTKSQRISPKRAIKQLEKVVRDSYRSGKPISHIFFEDGTFATRSGANGAMDKRVSLTKGTSYNSNDWTSEFIESTRALNQRLEAAGMKPLQFAMQTRSDTIVNSPKDSYDFEARMRAFKEVGLEGVYIGVESLDDDSLKEKGKKESVALQLSAIDYLLSIGVNVTTSAIADPGQEDKSVMTMEKLMQRRVPEVFIEYRKVLPDTPDARRVIDEKGNKLDVHEVIDRYSRGQLNYGSPSIEDNAAMIVKSLGFGKELQVVSDDELKQGAERLYAQLDRVAAENGYQKVDGQHGHYVLAA